MLIYATPSRSGRAGVAPPSWLVLLTAAAFIGLLFLLRHQDYAPVWLEDLPVYATAVHAFRAGIFPYSTNLYELHFVYPPLALYMAAGIEYVISAHTARVLFIAVHLFSMLALPFVLARFFLRAPWWGPVLPLLVLCAEPALFGFRALYSANVAPTLYLVMLLAAIPGVRANRWSWFYLVVLLAASVKITFLVFLLLPLFAGRAQSLQSILTSGLAVALNVFQMLAFPALYAGYKAALVKQVAGQKLYGYGILGFLARTEMHLHPAVGVFTWGCFLVSVLFLLTVVFLLRQQSAFQPGAAQLIDDHPALPSTLWFGLLLIAVILANPRVMHYDMYIALFAAYVVIAASFRLDRWRLVALAVGLYLPTLLARSWSIRQTYELVVVLAAFALGAWRLWNTSPPEHVGPQPVASSREFELTSMHR